MLAYQRDTADQKGALGVLSYSHTKRGLQTLCQIFNMCVCSDAHKFHQILKATDIKQKTSKTTFIKEKTNALRTGLDQNCTKFQWEQFIL